MAHMNVFEGKPFSLMSMVQAFKNQEFLPQYLGQFFTEKGVTTRQVSIEEKGKVLSLIPFSERGSEVDEATGQKRKIRYFDTARIAKSDTIQASEIANIRAFGEETELQQVQAEVAERVEGLNNDVEVTLEYLRLGALQGKFLDPADGSVVYNWFTEFGVTQAAEVNFALTTDTTDVKKLINKEKRRIIKESGGAVTPKTTVVALCGDDFYDAFTSHPNVEKTFLNWSAAQDLRGDEGVFGVFRFGGVDWVNYRGTDDEKVAIGADKVIMFPTNVKENLVHALAPADEYMDFVNTKGIKTYSMLEQDPATNKKWVRPEVKSYPLIYVSRPKTLGRGKMA